MHDDTPLGTYRAKRDFHRTTEPAGDEARRNERPTFVVQKHAARRLHYDVRLEMAGVLRSWAVPKGPSLDPAQRRLSMLTEDHPMAYADFEGVIPKGEYGGGTVIVWDRGTYSIVDDQGDPVDADDMDALAQAAFDHGRLRVRFDGERLRGTWNLVRMQGRGEENAWLFIKSKIDAVDPDTDLTERHVTSVLSERTLDDVESQEGTPAEVARRLRRRRTLRDRPVRLVPGEDH